MLFPTSSHGDARPTGVDSAQSKKTVNPDFKTVIEDREMKHIQHGDVNQVASLTHASFVRRA
jgi:hypothetical protein